MQNSVPLFREHVRSKEKGAAKNSFWVERSKAGQKLLLDSPTSIDFSPKISIEQGPQIGFQVLLGKCE